MKHLTILLITFLGLAAIFENASAAEEMTCKEFVAGLTKKQLSGIQTCNKKLGLKTSKERKEKLNCVFKCLMIQEKVLNSEGLFDETLEEFIKNEMPPSLMEKGGALFRGCVTRVGDSLDPKEEYCKSYDGVIKCLLEVVGNICK